MLVAACWECSIKRRQHNGSGKIMGDQKIGFVVEAILLDILTT